ncbi:DUF3134 domain-containing protein (plasmid) [Kovacikia minuta CCNUW1]|uniref:DUF3134 family protein n=1 Tax=Kovacikia minuta TaxID=2931930 RepID=UPI001CC901C2|nr:DUF3134 family protein [Kovacikia minuta]UBF29783.1 DUF3134 domain-containing protein [Kovacikia minuta CCNUW1]
MTTCHNPSLYEEPRNQPTRVIPPIPRETLLHWLESSGRFRSSEMDESQDYSIAEELDSFLEADAYASEHEEEEEEID